MFHRCAACETFVLFGGVRRGTKRYCSDYCSSKTVIANATGHIEPGIIDRSVRAIYDGPCPICGQAGSGVDYHSVRWVFSAVFITYFPIKQYTCCRNCAAKRQLLASAATLLFGWWGIYGFFLTPVHIGSNIVDMIAARRRNEPSQALRKGVHLALASQIPSATCTKCGYDLRVQREMNLPRCPECGTEISNQSSTATTTATG